MLDPNDPAVRSAVFGKQVEDFINGDIGSYLLGRVDDELQSAQAALNKCSPWRRRRITELQNQIWRCESFKDWLADAVISGQQAMKLLENQDD